MAEPQLSIRSARARALAHKLAKKERRSISQVVERALEHYAKSEEAPEKEPASQFWRRLVRENHSEGGTDLDLDAILAEHRKPHGGINL